MVGGKEGTQMVKIDKHTQSLPSKIGVGYMLTRAENIGMYAVESEKRGVGYVFGSDGGSDEIAIITAQGYIRMDVQSARKMIQELEGILDDVDDLRRMGVVV